MSGATATRDGFTDSKGRTMTYEQGVREAARCVMHQGEAAFIEELMRWNLAPDEILEWLVYPESGEFADELIR